jgi:hypothetical protein
MLCERKGKRWIYLQTLRRGVEGKDTNLRVVFKEDAPDTLILLKWRALPY